MGLGLVLGPSLACVCIAAENSGIITFGNKYILSTRIRTARSIRGLRLAPAISQAERRKVEQIMANALIQLEGELAGDYSPLAGSESYPEKLGGMSAEEEDQLRADRHNAVCVRFHHAKSAGPS